MCWFIALCLLQLVIQLVKIRWGDALQRDEKHPPSAPGGRSAKVQNATAEGALQGPLFGLGVRRGAQLRPRLGQDSPRKKARDGASVRASARGYRSREAPRETVQVLL